MKKFHVVDNHHEVLTFWAALQRETFAPLTVLTVDHHTDVVRAFRDDSRKIAPGAWRDAVVVQQAVSELKHDEHFDWAVRSGLIREAFIASHTCATLPANEKLHVCCDPAWPDENEIFREPEKYRSLADSVLESDYLFRQFGDPEKYGRFILDIDCDYILTEKALYPRDDMFFRRLLEKAEIITVSLETDWVRLLRFRGESISSAQIVSRITNLL